MFVCLKYKQVCIKRTWVKMVKKVPKYWYKINLPIADCEVYRVGKGSIFYAFDSRIEPKNLVARHAIITGKLMIEVCALLLWHEWLSS